MIRSRKGGIVLAIVAVTTALLLIACPEPSTGNSAPAFSSTTQTISTANTMAGETVGTANAATDADSGDTLTYKLSGDDASNFAISSARVITVATGKTLMVGESYEVTVTANDGTADSSNTLTITITVTSGTGGTNTAPTFGSTPTQTISTANTVVGETVGTATAATDADSGDTLTYTLGGTDASNFSIDASTRVITVATALMVGQSYEVTVTANDGTEDSSNMLAITITVTANTAPTFGSTPTQTISTANTMAGETVGTANAATDENSGDELTYTLGGTDASDFSIDMSTRVITVATGTTLTVGSYEVTVTANDGTEPSSDMLTITITVTSGTGGTNTAPTFGSTLTQTITTANTVAGSTVGTANAATDADSGDTLTYTLGGTDAGRFAISNERVITVATALTAGSYEVTVTANDGTENSSDMLTITITVTGPTVSGRVAIGAAVEGAMVTALCGTTATAAAETNSDGVYNIPLDDLDNDDCDDVVRVQAEFNVNGVSRTLYSLSTVAEDSDGDIVANVTPQSDVLLRGALAKVFDEGTDLGISVVSSSDLFEAGFELESIPDASAEESRRGV